MDFFLILQMILGVSGPLLLLWSGWDLIQALRFKKRALLAEGRVIARDEYTAEGGRTYPMPIIRFHHQGQSHTFKSRYSRSGGDHIYPVGRQLAVWFLP